jgi:hypothetical protein
VSETPLEQRIRIALERDAATAYFSPDARDRIDRRLREAGAQGRRRLFLTGGLSAAGIALVVAVALVASSLFGRNRTDQAVTAGTSGPGGSPTGPSATTSPGNPANARWVVLWFPDYTGRRVSSEARDVSPQPADVLRALAEGPRSPDLSASIPTVGSIPPATFVQINDHTARVTYSPPLADALARQAVARTLLGLEGITAVTIDGNLVRPDPALLANVAFFGPPPGTRVEQETVTISGSAAAFEGTVNWVLRDTRGRALKSGFTTGGSLQHGPFEIKLAPTRRS